jgi:Zn-dependent protease
VDFSALIQTLLIYALPVLFAITLHEAAHGYVAHRLGDNTAWVMGRVTLNPLPHIDLMGTVLMPAMLYLVTGGNFLFGYAKPVPVRFGKLNHPKRDMVWVAIAGPLSNLIQAILWGVIFYALHAADVQERYFIEVCKAGLQVNVVMFAFNLFPLPPLDGGRVLVGVLPMRLALWVSRIEPWGFYIVMALVVLGIVNAIWMNPIMDVTFDFINFALTPIKWLLG